MTDTPQQLPAAVRENIDSYRSAVGIARAMLFADLPSIGALWANLAIVEQMGVALAMGHLVNELLADNFGLAGTYPRGAVPVAALVAHHENYLNRLATAFDQPAPATDQDQQ